MVEDSKERIMIVRDVREFAGKHQYEILGFMIDEARAQGLEPCDYNELGVANIYFRTKYTVEVGQPTGQPISEKQFVADVYVMFVKPGKLAPSKLSME